MNVIGMNFLSLTLHQSYCVVSFVSPDTSPTSTWLMVEFLLLILLVVTYWIEIFCMKKLLN